ncbi:hypothetical protein [Escherichia coli]|nr:hypothetical protein [Escherichia coli]
MDFRLQKCFIKHTVIYNEYDRFTT